MESRPMPAGGVSATAVGRVSVAPHVGLLLTYFSWSLAALLTVLLQVAVPVWVELFSRRLHTFRVLNPMPSAAAPVRPPDALVRLVDTPAHIAALPSCGRITSSTW